MSRIIRSEKDIQKSQVLIKKVGTTDDSFVNYCNRELARGYNYKGTAQNYPFYGFRYGDNCFYFTDKIIENTIYGGGSLGSVDNTILILDSSTTMEKHGVNNVRLGPLYLVIKDSVDFNSSNFPNAAIYFGINAPTHLGTLVFYSYKGGTILSDINKNKISIPTKNKATLTLQYSKVFEEKVRAYGASLGPNVTVSYQELTAEKEAALEKQVDACLALPD